jgi:hypothetical protein
MFVCRGPSAALATGNNNAEAAMEWVFGHMEDPDFNDPLPAAAPAAAQGGQQQQQQHDAEKVGGGVACLPSLWCRVVEALCC